MLIVYLVNGGFGTYHLYITDPPSITFFLQIPFTVIPKKRIRPWRFMKKWSINLDHRYYQAIIRMLRASKSIDEAEGIIRAMEHREIIYFYSL